MKNDLIILETYFNELEAGVVSSFLESKGIKAISKKDNCGGLSPNLTYIRGIIILVKKEDEEDARLLLSELNNSDT